MTIAENIGKNMHDVFFGGNWTTSNVKDQLEDVTWRESIQKIDGFNTIATLSYHLSYFVHEVIKVLEGNPLTAHDKYSFEHPPINSEEDWQKMKDNILSDAEKFSVLIKNLPDEILTQDFTDPKYGNYFRNLVGIIEHTHYHLGQIALIKKMIRKNEE